MVKLPSYLALSKENFRLMKFLFSCYRNNQNFIRSWLDSASATRREVNLQIYLAQCKISFLSLSSFLSCYHRYGKNKKHNSLCTMLRCGCDECVTSRQEDSLRHSRSRINAYRALASPSLIALSSKDPILTAFELSWELRRLSFLEHEFKVSQNHDELLMASL